MENNGLSWKYDERSEAPLSGRAAADDSALPDDWFVSDTSFLQLYPVAIRAYAKSHWTPIRVAKKAADFLGAEKGARVLDIGSGAGKFCLTAAYYRPEAFFYGVEQREEMVEHAERVKTLTGLQNLSFMHGNINTIDLRNYDHFYFYNSFYENLVCADRVNDGIEYSEELYNYYNRYLYRQLDRTPSGTRLVTFHSLEPEIPRDFHIVASDMGNLLKFWVKE